MIITIAFKASIRYCLFRIHPRKIIRFIGRLFNLQTLIFIGLISVFLQSGFHSSQAQISLLDHRLYLHGDTRNIYFSRIGTNSDGTRQSVYEFRNRTRIGLGGLSGNKFEWQIRYAAQFSSNDLNFYPGWHTTNAENNGLESGEGAFDLANIRWLPASNFHITAGRLQSRFSLPGAISNTFIKSQSPGTKVDWTDGVHAYLAMSKEWEMDFVLAWHHKNAPTHTMRPPLDIPGSSVPFTFFNQIRHVPTLSRIHLLALDVLYSPDALITDINGNRSDYLVTSVKSVLGWRLAGERMLTWGTETAWVFTRPQSYMVGLSAIPDFFDDDATGSRAGGAGFQTNLSVYELFPGHRIGFLAALAGPSILTTPNFSNNQMVLDIRYTWQFNRQLVMDTRVRYRGDHRQYHGAETRHKEFHPFARLTYFLR